MLDFEEFVWADDLKQYNMIFKNDLRLGSENVLLSPYILPTIIRRHRESNRKNKNFAARKAESLGETAEKTYDWLSGCTNRARLRNYEAEASAGILGSFLIVAGILGQIGLYKVLEPEIPEVLAFVTLTNIGSSIFEGVRSKRKRSKSNSTTLETL